MIGLVLLIVALAGAIVVAAVRKQTARVDTVWREAADELGMHFRPGALFVARSIDGFMHGSHVRVDKITKNAGNHSESFTRYRVDHPQPLDLGLKLQREGFFSGVSKFFGTQDIEVGDPAFDGEVVVKGHDPSRVVEFLTPSRRLRILRLFQSFKGLEIDDRSLTYRSRGVAKVAREIVSTVRRLALATSRLSAEAPPDSPLDQAIEARREGRLDEALEHVQANPAPDGAVDPEARMLEGQILEAGGRREEAAEVLERASVESPEDEELEELAREAALPPEPEAEFEPPVDAEIDVDALCEELFAPDLMSFEARRKFDERYKDRSVRWSGKLRQASHYSIDLVFGSKPGTKLVLDIHEFTDGPFGRTVQAIVQMPEETLERLQSRIGDEVHFKGSLVGCDPLMRNVYVGSATPVEA
jgi:hypothetical protein